MDKTTDWTTAPCLLPGGGRAVGFRSLVGRDLRLLYNSTGSVSPPWRGILQVGSCIFELWGGECVKCGIFSGWLAPAMTGPDSIH